MSIWVESLGRNFEEALDLLAAAVGGCTDELWESSMWEVPTDDFGSDPPGLDGKPVIDSTTRTALVQKASTPWSVAWHALECLDYDLTGEFEPWAPPPPFTEHGHWQITGLPRAWTQSEILDYIQYCRLRVRDTLGALTDESARAPLPETHRYGGQPHLWVISSLVGHTIEHGAQIRQFVTAAHTASRMQG